MPTLAIAHLRNVRMGPEILEYMRAVDATIASFGGRFLVHGGGNKTVLEGSWPGDLVIVEFPDRASAEDWYASEAYQEILPLRTGNSDGDTLLVDTVPGGYRAGVFADKIAAARSG
jgi:uncharacterized protein (DUF1330 family)